MPADAAVVAACIMTTLKSARGAAGDCVGGGIDDGSDGGTGDGADGGADDGADGAHEAFAAVLVVADMSACAAAVAVCIMTMLKSACGAAPVDKAERNCCCCGCCVPLGCRSPRGARAALACVLATEPVQNRTSKAPTTNESIPAESELVALVGCALGGTGDCITACGWLGASADVTSGEASDGAVDCSTNCDSSFNDASGGASDGGGVSDSASNGERDCSIGASRDGTEEMVDDASGGAMDGDGVALGGASGLAGDCSMDCDSSVDDALGGALDGDGVSDGA